MRAVCCLSRFAPPRIRTAWEGGEGIPKKMEVEGDEKRKKEEKRRRRRRRRRLRGGEGGERGGRKRKKQKLPKLGCKRCQTSASGPFLPTWYSRSRKKTDTQAHAHTSDDKQPKVADTLGRGARAHASPHTTGWPGPAATWPATYLGRHSRYISTLRGLNQHGTARRGSVLCWGVESAPFQAPSGGPSLLRGSGDFI